MGRGVTKKVSQNNKHLKKKFNTRFDQSFQELKFLHNAGILLNKLSNKLREKNDEGGPSARTRQMSTIAHKEGENGPITAPPLNKSKQWKNMALIKTFGV